MQFKLEGQMIARNPQWDLDHRRLLHRIDHAGGHHRHRRQVAIRCATATSPPSTRPTPTSCRPRSRRAWTACGTRSWPARSSGSTCSYLLTQRLDVPGARRPPDLPRLRAGGRQGRVPAAARSTARPLRGQALFDAIDAGARSARDWTDADRASDRDLLWYLWCGPRSPLFGKDRIATLENDFVADKATHHETKNPYFELIHEVAVLRQDPDGVRRRSRPRPDRQRPRAGEDREGRVAAEAQRQGDHHRRRFLGGLRRPRLHAGAGGRPDAAGDAPPLRVGRGRGARRRGHHPARRSCGGSRRRARCRPSAAGPGPAAAPPRSG